MKDRKQKRTEHFVPVQVKAFLKTFSFSFFFSCLWVLALGGKGERGRKPSQKEKCRATKGEVLDGEPFVQWKEQLHPTDLLPGVAVDLRGECPLHGTRIVVSQLLNYTCNQMGELGGALPRLWRS